MNLMEDQTFWRPDWAIPAAVFGLVLLLVPGILCASVLSGALRTIGDEVFDYHGVIIGVVGLVLVLAGAVPLAWFLNAGGKALFWVGTGIAVAWIVGLFVLFVVSILVAFQVGR